MLYYITYYYSMNYYISEYYFYVVLCDVIPYYVMV